MNKKKKNDTSKGCTMLLFFAPNQMLISQILYRLILILKTVLNQLKNYYFVEKTDHYFVQGNVRNSKLEKNNNKKNRSLCTVKLIYTMH